MTDIDKNEEFQKIEDEQLKKDEADKLRYASAMSELIQFVRLIAKRHRLTPMEVLGVWMLAQETILSSGANIEASMLIRELKESGLLAKRATKTDPKEVKNEGYL